MAKKVNKKLNTEYWINLRRGHICGVVDSYDCVHSQFTGESIAFHSDLYPEIRSYRWRWNFDRGIYYLPSDESKPLPEHFDLIRRHITRKYGIQWWDNGFHDMDFFLKKMGKDPDNT